MTGAQFGLAALWTALFSFPLMCAVQLMCARLGIVSGRGLAGVIRRRFPRWVLWSSCGILLVANGFNIGADLGGMGEALQMVTGIKSYIWSPVLAVAIVASLILLSYKRLAQIFKWLTLVLFAYVITAFWYAPTGARSCMRRWCPGFNGPKSIWPCWSDSSAPPSRRIFSSGRPRRRSRRNVKWGVFR